MVFQGSKTKYAKYIVPILQKELNNQYIIFIDAMVGGANIIQYIKNDKRIGVDINPYLIALYQYAQNDNRTWPDIITKEDWNKAKNFPEQCEPWFVGLVAYFASYSARGFSGGYCLNGQRDYYHERLRNFEKQIPFIKDVTFIKYDTTIPADFYNCVVYFDPPYKNTKKYDYCKDFNYDKFWNNVRYLSKQNKVFVSEQEAPNDFTSILSLDVKRNSFGSKPVYATENLFIYTGG